MTRAAAPSFAFGGAPAARRAGVALWLGGTRLRMDRRMRRASRDESGSSIVEFALASTILFMLVFGVMAICLALYSYNVTAEAAREATRFAIVRGSACTKTLPCNATLDQIQAHIRGIGFPGINSTSLSVTSDCCWPSSNKNPGSPVQVTVQYTFPLAIPFVPTRTLTMSSTSQMLISQ
jgi:Flp pilus assembly protein TadG